VSYDSILPEEFIGSGIVNDRKPNLSTCFHEAGHCVTAILMDIPLKRIDVYRKINAKRIGLCAPIKRFYAKGLEGLNEGDKRHDMGEWQRRSALMTVMGPIAQAKFEMELVEDIEGGEKDFEDAAKMCDVENCLKIAISFVDEPDVWKAICEVATHLSHFWQIPPEVAREIVRRTIPKKRIIELRWSYRGGLTIEQSRASPSSKV
jgi:hypothetical protein